MIIEYLSRFVQLKNGKGHGNMERHLSKLTNGETEIVLQPQNDVTIINGLGRAGMTLSFGLCEQVVSANVISHKSAFGVV